MVYLPYFQTSQTQSLSRILIHNMINAVTINRLILALLLFLSHVTMAQQDSLILLNGNVLVGEFKSMDKGVLIMETDFSSDDFRIKWSEIKEIYSTTLFLITTSDGKRYNSAIRSSLSGKVFINDGSEQKEDTEVSLPDIVFLKSIDTGFASSINASVDIGYSFTKANNFTQLTIRSNVGYLAERWNADVSYNTLHSTQDETEPIRRIDGGLAYKYYLPKDWYLPVDLTFLSNTEQLIKLRLNGRLGVGKYLLHTNSSYWGIAAGLSFVSDRFESEEPDKKSLEGYMASELNLFDIGDFNLLTKVVLYPSITESHRWRADFVFDTKYDLPLDFYIKMGFTLNFDNQPAEGAPNSDYVFSTGFGWEW